MLEQLLRSLFVFNVSDRARERGKSRDVGAAHSTITKHTVHEAWFDEPFSLLFATGHRNRYIVGGQDECSRRQFAYTRHTQPERKPRMSGEHEKS